MPLLWYLVSGVVETVSPGDGEVAAEQTGMTIVPGKGGWLGELWDPNESPD